MLFGFFFSVSQDQAESREIADTVLLSAIGLWLYRNIWSHWVILIIGSVAATRIGFWTWIWSTRHELGARSGPLISMLKKHNWFRLTCLITMVLLTWKWMGLFLRKNHFLRCWSWPSLLNGAGAHILSLLLKLPPTKLEP